MPIERKKRSDAGWDRVPDVPGRGRAPRERAGGRQRYTPNCPRIDGADCHHTQYLDTDLSRGLVRCLDCGHLLSVSENWRVVESEPPLDDADLVDRRRWHNDIWFDKTYKILPTDPDDPERDRLVLRTLRDKGVKKL